MVFHRAAEAEVPTYRAGKAAELLDVAMEFLDQGRFDGQVNCDDKHSAYPLTYPTDVGDEPSFAASTIGIRKGPEPGGWHVG